MKKLSNYYLIIVLLVILTKPGFSIDLRFGSLDYAGTLYQNYGGEHCGIDYAGQHNTKLFSTNFGKTYFTHYEETDPNGACCTISNCTPNNCNRKPNRVVIEHLLDDGKVVYSRFLHLAHSGDVLSNFNYISKNQHIGNEGNTGFTCSKYTTAHAGTHLHYEINDFIKTPELLGAYGNGCSSSNIHAIDPNNGYNGTGESNKSILIPFFSNSFENPSFENYPIFGYADECINIKLRLSIQNQKKFKAIGVLAKSGLNRNIQNDIPVSDGKWATQSWLTDDWKDTPDVNLNIGIKEYINTCATYPSGEYQFMAFIAYTEEENIINSYKGYPLAFEILEKNSIVIDNDQSEFEVSQYVAPIEDKIVSTIPGYFLQSDLLKGQSNAVTSWRPNRYGRFQILIYIPYNIPESIDVRYKIVIKNEDNDIFISEPINQSSPGWHQLLSKIGNTTTDNWYFNKESRISLHLNTTESYRGNEWGNVGIENSNANITENQYVAVDAIKFVGGEVKLYDNNTKSDIEKIAEILANKGITESDSVARKIYRNFMEQSINFIKINDNMSIAVVHNLNNKSIYLLNESELFSLSTLDGSISSTPSADSAIVINHPELNNAMTSGKIFAQKIELKNIGTNTWSSDYKLKHESGVMSQNPIDVNVPKDTLPDETCIFEITMKTPNILENYEEKWNLYNPDDEIVIAITIKIVVTELDCALVVNQGELSNNLNTDVTYSQKIILKNIGINTWNSDYKLVHISGNLSQYHEDMVVVEEVEMDDQYVFEILIKTPDSIGNYIEKWNLVNPSGETIKEINLAFNVVDLIPEKFTINDLKKISGDNPKPQELSDYILQKCREYNYPPIVLKAILLKEGQVGNKWKQFSSESGYSHDTIVYHADTSNGIIKSYGLGLFQITYPVDLEGYFESAKKDEIIKVVSDWKYNVDMAFIKLQSKWNSNIKGLEGEDANPAIIENWFYAIAWYNGSGSYAKSYVEYVYGYMKDKQNVEIALSSSIDKEEIIKYYKFLDISSPYIIEGYEDSLNGVILAKSPPSYTLDQIRKHRGKIQKWLKEYEVYIDITYNQEDDFKNNCFEVSKTIALNKPINAKIDFTGQSNYYDGDCDYFKFETPQKIQVSIFTTGTTDTQGTLFNCCDENISQCFMTNNSISGENNNFKIDQLLEKGTYYLKVRHEDKINGTGDYQLHIQNEKTDFWSIAMKWFESALSQIEQLIESFNEYSIQLYKKFRSGHFSISQRSLRTISTDANELQKPDVNATRAETLLLCMLVKNIEIQEGLLSSYSDVDQSNELYEIIETATKLGFVEGMFDDNQNRIFKPTEPISRIEALKILFKTFQLDLLESPKGRTWSDNYFVDIDKNHWSYKYIRAAYLYEIMDGFGNGKFGPNNFITRSQLIKIVSQALKFIENNENYITAGLYIEPEFENYSEPNNPPNGNVLITYLNPGHYKLNANFSDPDNDKLNYYWELYDGSILEISPDDSKLEWQLDSNDTNNYQIKLRVQDNRGLITEYIRILKIDESTLNEGLIAYYPFNGNANDESGSENNGTVYGSTVTNDRFGNNKSAYYFDGKDDYIHLAPIDNIAINNGTLALWFQLSNAFNKGDDTINLFSKDISTIDVDSMELTFEQNTGKLYFDYGESSEGVGIKSDKDSWDIRWYFAVITWGDDGIQMFIDGTKQSETIMVKSPVGAYTTHIGTHQATQWFFKGIIDDIYIYNKVLSESEILQLYRTQP
ncbi:protein containing Peptidase M23, partial [Candidatus Magnetomorum sp. HK-1]